MPNANLNLLNALAGLKRADKPAFDKLMAKFNLDRWQDAREADADAIIMECHAHTTGVKLSDAEGDMGDGDAGESTGDVQGDLNKLADAVHGRGKPAAKASLAVAASGAKTVHDALNAMGKAANKARTGRLADGMRSGTART